jgi:hypothetical protein
MLCLFMHTTCSYTVRNKNMKNGCVRVDIILNMIIFFYILKYTCAYRVLACGGA